MSVTAKQLANLRPFKPGENGNPRGKRKGARDRVSAKFVEALETAFEEAGLEAVRRCRDEEPAAFLRVCGALLPKEVEITRDPFDELTDEQLDSAVAALRAIAVAQVGGDDAGQSEGQQSAQALPALPEAG